MNELPIDSLASEMMVDASEIFGLSTNLHSGSYSVFETRGDIATMLINNPLYQGGLLFLFLFFFYIIYLYRAQLEVLVRVVTRKDYIEKLYGERSNHLNQFVFRSSLLGCLLLGLIAVRFASRFADVLHFRSSSQEFMLFIAIFLIAMVYVYRKIMIKLIVFVGEQSSFFKEYNYLCSVCWTIGVMVLSPLFIFGGGFQGYRGDLMLNMVGVMGVLVIFLYLYNSYLFFINQKVSKLQWILYLCAVDFFPISLMVALGRT